MTVLHETRDRDTEQLQSDFSDRQQEETGLLDTTTQSEHQSTPFRDSDDEVSTFSLIAAALILAALQCIFLCVH